MIRDTVLAASGLLVEKIGGKSVKPYQPDGLWEAISFVGSNTGTFKQDEGEALYRRSIYTFWKRTVAPPMMVLFDSAGRETCIVRESRTNTPLQALTTLNEIVFTECAQALALHALEAGGKTDDERVAYAFRRVLSRRPTPDARPSPPAARTASSAWRG